MTSVHSTSRKVTISLPTHLLEYADRKAEEKGSSRSQLLAEFIAEMKAKEQQELAAEGYRFYAKEATEFAEVSMPAFHEVIEHAR